ncbi:hypothetical protein FQN54_007352 [Arachnomyces sp. PD_36]|nr:hypothetical protein FQN54_007352 [Arachnomyces sp. PD_36]
MSQSSDFAEEEKLSEARKHVELLMDRSKKTSRINQPQMEYELKRIYGSRQTSIMDFEVWSPVVEGGWIDQDAVRAAHIVPSSVGQEESMMYIFGKDTKGEINSARNGLWLPTNFEKKFNNFHIVIVPAEEFREWKVMVLDRDDFGDVAAYHGGKTYNEMDGMKLVFQNSARPRARYFYSHYLCAMLHHCRKMKGNGLTMDGNAAAKISELDKAWGFKGSYLRKDVMLGFMDRLRDSVGDGGVEMIRCHSPEGIVPNEAEDLGAGVAHLDLDGDGEKDEDSS